jgi:hypothetical protein
VKVSIIAHPNSKKPRIEKDLFNSLHVYVSEPPLEGKANNAIRDALTKYFEVKKSDILIISGEKSKNKIFEVLT